VNRSKVAVASFGMKYKLVIGERRMKKKERGGEREEESYGRTKHAWKDTQMHAVRM